MVGVVGSIPIAPTILFPVKPGTVWTVLGFSLSTGADFDEQQKIYHCR
jgi:hypothetical protein